MFWLGIEFKFGIWVQIKAPTWTPRLELVFLSGLDWDLHFGFGLTFWVWIQDLSFERFWVCTRVFIQGAGLRLCSKLYSDYGFRFTPNRNHKAASKSEILIQRKKVILNPKPEPRSELEFKCKPSKPKPIPKSIPNPNLHPNENPNANLFINLNLILTQTQIWTCIWVQA